MNITKAKASTSITKSRAADHYSQPTNGILPRIPLSQPTDSTGQNPTAVSPTNSNKDEQSNRDNTKELDMALSKEQLSWDKAQLALYMHMKFGHQNMPYIRSTIDKAKIK